MDTIDLISEEILNMANDYSHKYLRSEAWKIFFCVRSMRRQATNESCGGGEGCQEGREEPRPIYKLIGTHL